MNALALFAASFTVVFALGFQQMNVTARLYPLAFGTSLVIGLSQLVQFKYLPGPTSTLDVTAFLFGNACGIVAAMKAHPALMAWLERRALTEVDAFDERFDKIVRHLEQPQASSYVRPASLSESFSTGFIETPAANRSERADLESDIALEAAVTEVESNCPANPMGHLHWFDTGNASCGPGTEAVVQRNVDRAVRYLELRDQIVRHPTVHALVRFKA